MKNERKKIPITFTQILKRREQKWKATGTKPFSLILQIFKPANTTEIKKDIRNATTSKTKTAAAVMSAVC